MHPRKPRSRIAKLLVPTSDQDVVAAALCKLDSYTGLLAVRPNPMIGTGVVVDNYPMEVPTNGRYKGRSVPDASSRVQPSEIRWLDETIAIIAEFGSASLGLVAWELNVDESEIEPAWEQAKREGLIRLEQVCPTTKEQMFVLALPSPFRRAGDGHAHARNTDSKGSGEPVGVRNTWKWCPPVDLRLHTTAQSSVDVPSP